MLRMVAEGAERSVALHKCVEEVCAEANATPQATGGFEERDADRLDQQATGPPHAGTDA